MHVYIVYIYISILVYTYAFCDFFHNYNALIDIYTYLKFFLRFY